MEVKSTVLPSVSVTPLAGLSVPVSNAEVKFVPTRKSPRSVAPGVNEPKLNVRDAPVDSVSVNVTLAKFTAELTSRGRNPPVKLVRSKLFCVPPTLVASKEKSPKSTDPACAAAGHSPHTNRNTLPIQNRLIDPPPRFHRPCTLKQV